MPALLARDCGVFGKQGGVATCDQRQIYPKNYGMAATHTGEVETYTAGSHTGEARRRGQGSGELGNKPISRIPKLINCPLSALYIVQDISSLRPQYRIGLYCAGGSSANINCLTPRPHIWSNWSKGSWFYCTSALQVIGHLLLSPPWFYQFSVQTNIQIINFRDWCGCGFITLWTSILDYIKEHFLEHFRMLFKVSTYLCCFWLLKISTVCTHLKTVCIHWHHFRQIDSLPGLAWCAHGSLS